MNNIISIVKTTPARNAPVCCIDMMDPLLTASTFRELNANIAYSKVANGNANSSAFLSTIPIFVKYIAVKKIAM